MSQCGVVLALSSSGSGDRVWLIRLRQLLNSRGKVTGHLCATLGNQVSGRYLTLEVSSAKRFCGHAHIMAPEEWGFIRIARVNHPALVEAHRIEHPRRLVILLSFVCF